MWRFCKEETAEMVEMEGRGRREKWVPRGKGGKRVLRGQRETKERQDQREVMDILVIEDYLEFLVPRVVVGPLVCRDLRKYMVHQEEGQSTLAGEGLTVLVTSKLNLSILEELEEVTTIVMVGQLTSSAYLMILSTLHMTVEQIILFHLEELNIRQPLASHFVVIITTTCHVLCAMPPPETQY